MDSEQVYYTSWENLLENQSSPERLFVFGCASFYRHFTQQANMDPGGGAWWTWVEIGGAAQRVKKII